MTYRLFLDDEREPVNNMWLIARSSFDAIQSVLFFGMPLEIAFDHDLGLDFDGKEDTSIIFINWLAEQVISGARFPEGFKYSIHSQNPVGVENIKHKMDALLQYQRDNPLML